MMKFLLALMLTISFSAQAAEITVQRSQGYVGNCDNPTARTDGTPLTASEIAYVDYYLYPVGETDPAKYGSKQTIMGGCRATQIVTKDLVSGVAYRAFGTATDMDDRTSAMSAGSLDTFKIQNANPNAPGNLRGQ